MHRSASGSSILPFLLVLLAACMSQSGTPAASSGTSGASAVTTARPLADRVAHGRLVVMTTACSDCHGGMTNPESENWLVGARPGTDSFPVGPFKTYPRNLTPDMTGVGRYTERQIFNALRYGLRPDKTPDVTITSSTPGQGNFPAEPHFLAPSMPWMVWRHLSDDDIWSIAAYLKHGVRPVKNEPPASEGPPDNWREASSSPDFGPYPAVAHPTENETAVSTPQILRGRQLIIQKACSGCHGGGPNPAAKGFLAGVTDTARDEFQIGPFRTRPRNLTPDNTTGIGRFSERQIFNALRYGLRPGETPDVEITSTTPGQGNHPARPKYLAPPMPWPSWRHMPDSDLWAIAAYLKNGVKPVSNRVADSQGPPDFWASAYTVEIIGPYPAKPYPTAREKLPTGME